VHAALTVATGPLAAVPASLPACGSMNMSAARPTAGAAAIRARSLFRFFFRC
jgi:hypothetical protein